MLLTRLNYPGNIWAKQGILMKPDSDTAYIAFDDERRIAAGDLPCVARAAKATLDRRGDASILIFDSSTGGPIDIDFRGAIDDVLARLPQAPDAPEVAGNTVLSAPRGPGRPKLGVIAREVTLLPRHWEWLAEQPGGASVALRKLVEAARRDRSGQDETRLMQERAYHFMAAMAGDLPGFEEAIRALYAPDPLRFAELIAPWAADVREHASRLAGYATDLSRQASS
jgi:hypothetical protein